MFLEYAKKNRIQWDSWKFTETENFAIHIAVANENLAAVKLLLKYDFNFGQANKNKKTALILALDNSEFRIAQELLKHDTSCNVIGKYILNAISEGNLERAKLFLEYAKKNRIQWDSCKISETENFAIHIAVANKNLEAVKLLLKYDFNFGQENKNKKTALILALDNSEFRIAQELLKHDTSCNVIGKYIFNAIKNESLDRAKIYLEYARKYRIRWDSWSDAATENFAIHYAVLNKDLAAVKILLKYKVDYTKKITMAKQHFI